MSNTKSNRDQPSIDVCVGRRVRVRRREIRMSLEGLAAALGLSYQQVQKYECGSNRISVSRLYEIAAALQTDITFFYADLPRPTREDGPPSHVVRADAVAATPGGHAMLDAYLRLPPRLKRSIVQLACNLADHDDDGRRSAQVAAGPS